MGICVEAGGQVGLVGERANVFTVMNVKSCSCANEKDSRSEAAGATFVLQSGARGLGAEDSAHSGVMDRDHGIGGSREAAAHARCGVVRAQCLHARRTMTLSRRMQRTAPYGLSSGCVQVPCSVSLP